ncbi:hypothetical protein BU26DRAFT_522223 [Trematosphaeria pertusa]|uniref:Uncharacterized protein n=1 Tax=Trematosphaeria pertusa TaxID=390896 RepID=A0A6A6I482_9PLEO|nr:uncharacterized protein BU26DRAFT_522223 [Trematosphaeria pertusa]KAF2245097.1 hypothetical protein BU26DRAFT_522223 [Trematosphaeria pertusa]
MTCLAPRLLTWNQRLTSTKRDYLSAVPKEVDASSALTSRARGKRKRTKITARLPAVEDPWSAKEPTDRVRRSPRLGTITKLSTSRRPGGDGANLDLADNQVSTKKLIRSRAQRQRDAPTKNGASQLPSTGAFNYTTRGGPTVRNRLPGTTEMLRRSRRIAAQIKNTPVEHKQKGVAPVTGSRDDQGLTLSAASNIAIG